MQISVNVADVIGTSADFRERSGYSRN
jgi:hypothetical protein